MKALDLIYFRGKSHFEENDEEQNALEQTVDIYIVYEINKNNPKSSYPALENCFFGPVKLTKNNDIDKYKYSGYGIGFEFFCTCW